MIRIQVSELAIYPVKSLAGIDLGQVEIDAFGFHMDRRWMVVDPDGVMLTQRKKARMCLIRPRLEETGLSLSAPDMPDIRVVHDAAAPRRQVSVWKDRCEALDCGDEAADWLSRFLDTPCRLVFFPQDGMRQVDPAYAREGEGTAFSDGFPVLLISRASLDDLNRRLETPVAMCRFRPNLVVEGCEAFAEDGWKRIRVGELVFRVVKPCSRCIIPNIDPQTGRKGAEPARTLSTYRRRDKQIFFGQNLIAEGRGRLETGMGVEILE